MREEAIKEEEDFSKQEEEERNGQERIKEGRYHGWRMQYEE